MNVVQDEEILKAVKTIAISLQGIEKALERVVQELQIVTAVVSAKKS